LLFLQNLLIPPLSVHAATSSADTVRLSHSTHLLKQICSQPPQNINLMALTDSQLSLYGLPLHALIDQNPQYWSNLFAHIKQHVCDTSPASSHRTHQLRPGSRSSASLLYSQNWAGNVDYGNRGTYRIASVDFYVPKITNLYSDVSFWAGVGGDGDFTSPQVLVQAGVDISTTCCSIQYNESWWEVYPYNAE
jgi:hypothetical protein